MNILFLTMVSSLRNVEESGIYTDLIRKFRDEGHEVFVMAPNERRSGLKTELLNISGVHFLGVKTLNVTKTNIIEKGIGQVLMEYQFTSAMRKFWQDVKFDIILYSTPPITFTKVITSAKKQSPNAMTYLLLKDIFPQNAVDIAMLTTKGLKGLLYGFFRRKEEKLYALSDYIGCMSPANVHYILKHNPQIVAEKVEIAPNSYAIPQDNNITDAERTAIRRKYNLPLDKPIFIYGGNMGKPQGIPFLIQCMDAVKNREDCHFVVVGNGTEYPKLEEWCKHNSHKSVSLFQILPKEDYDVLANACDVGLIFLDYRFTIPNYPSRLLPYLMTRKPIIAATDPNCDTGELAEKNGYGFWCPSNSVDKFVEVVDKMLTSDMKAMGDAGYQFFLNNYTIDHTYSAIVCHK